MLDSGAYVMRKGLHKIYLRRDSNVSFQRFAFRESFENTKPTADRSTGVRSARSKSHTSRNGLSKWAVNYGTVQPWSYRWPVATYSLKPPSQAIVINV